MKNAPFTLSLIILFFSFLSLHLNAQKSSKLTPEQLSFSDASKPFAGSYFSLEGLNVFKNFTSTSITDNAVSSGSDLVRSTIDDNGFTIQDFAVLPGSQSNLNRKRLLFETEGQGLVGLNKETWTMGITDVGAFDGADPVQSAFFLRYLRIIDDIAFTFPILFVNPDQGDIGIGTTDQTFGGRLFVEESGANQVGIWSENNSISNAARWGAYSSGEGSGSGIRYGVVGDAQTSTGTKYGVYGQTFGTGTAYAVYANGNLAYTGTFGQVSDRKFKKNIRDFAALDRIMALQPRTFEMKQEEFKRMNLASGQQFGFIAQELQEIFPELVHDAMNNIPYKVGEDSLAAEEIKYLSVDYISLVPVLTKGMQEQQKMLDEKDERLVKLERENQLLLQKNSELEDRLDQLEVLVAQLMKNTAAQGNATTHTLSDAQLLQNQPNPFTSGTSIAHFIPESVKKAELQISDVSGRVLKTIMVDARGSGQTMLDTAQLSGGAYFYTLILDGKILDTKKMVLMRE